MNQERKRPESNIERQVLRQGGGLQREMQFEPTIFVAENHERQREVAGLQNLLPFDGRVRYSPTGEIYVASFPPAKAAQDMFPEEIRKKPKVARRRWSKLGTIETAIRQADHIASSYDKKSGESTQNTLTIVDHVKKLSYAYQQPGLNEEERQRLEEETAAVLVQTGYANATKPEKQEITDMMTSAGKRDRRQRINPSRSRLILSNAWIDLSRELIVGRKANEKYRTLHELLMRERALERFCLEQTKARIDEVLSMRSGSSEIDDLMRELKVFVYGYNSEGFIKVMPYSRAAAIARFALFGDGEKQDDVTGISSDIRKLAQFIGMEEALHYNGVPHIMKLSAQKQRERLGLVAGEIASTLEKGERDLTKSEKEITVGDEFTM